MRAGDRGFWHELSFPLFGCIRGHCIFPFSSRVDALCLRLAQNLASPELPACPIDEDWRTLPTSATRLKEEGRSA
jgi:hypothetical protein